MPECRRCGVALAPDDYELCCPCWLYVHDATDDDPALLVTESASNPPVATAHAASPREGS